MSKNDNASQSLSRAEGRGRLFVISAPSGAGKTSITSRLQQEGIVKLSISHTTRPPRGDEEHSKAYFFVSKEVFLKMRDDGRFLEWAQVYDHYYGTDRKWVEAQLAAGDDVLLEIDCQGAKQIKELLPQAGMIFIRPPDIATLRQRLLQRREDDEATVNRRLAAAQSEMAQQEYFDHVIINDRLEDAVARVSAIICPPDLSH